MRTGGDFAFMSKDEFILQIQKYKNELFLLAVSIVDDYHDAEDVVAETMLMAYEKIAFLKKEELFRFWLMKILVNNARMLLRKKKRFVFVDEIDSYVSVYEQDISDVWETVLSLDSELKTIVILYYYQGFQVNEIAKILKIPVGTVKSRLSRARKKLRTLSD